MTETAQSRAISLRDRRVAASPTDEELEALVLEFSASRDLRLRDELLAAHLPLVERLARHFTRRGEPYDDLVQAGTIGLIKALDRYEPIYGASFATYATKTIIGELKRHFRDTGWSVRPPRRVQELHLHLSMVSGELAQRLRRAPTIRELAQETGATDDEVLAALEAGRSYRSLSLDVPTERGEPMEDLLASVDHAIDEAELRATLARPVAGLTDHERLVVRLRFERSLTQAEIAAQVGSSQMHVSRILARCLRKLQRVLAEQS